MIVKDRKGVGSKTKEGYASKGWIAKEMEEKVMGVGEAG